MKHLWTLLLLLAPGVAWAQDRPLDDQLVLYWPGNETSGDLIDAVGDNDATETSGTIGTWDRGRDYLAADTEYHALADNATVSLNNTDFTWHAKVRLRSKPANAMDLISKFTATGNQRAYRVLLNNTNDRFQFVLGTAAGATGGPLVNADNLGSPSVDRWYDLFAWLDRQHGANGSVNIQINDLQNNFTASVSGAPIDDTSPLHIGALGTASPSAYLDGTQKELGLWKRVLTPAERLWFVGQNRSYSEIDAAVVTGARFLMKDGIWTWFNSPNAGYYNGKLVVGAVSDASPASTRIVEYDMNTFTSTATTLTPDHGQRDDHNNPSIILLKSGKWLANWSFHNGTSWCATSTNPFDATAWGSTVTVSTGNKSYCQTMQMDYSNTIYMFCRWWGAGGNGGQYLFTSTDDGATWSGPTNIVQNPDHRPYNRWWKTSGNRIDNFVNNATPEEAMDQGGNSLYHFYILVNPTTGVRTYHKSDGTLIGGDEALPITLDEMTQVYDGTTSGCWVLDGKVISGQPTCIFAVYPNHATASHEYWYARFNGFTFEVEKMADAGTTAANDQLASGSPHYPNGATLDPRDETKAYLSLEYGSARKIFMYHNVGAWVKGHELTRGVWGINARPYAIDAGGKTVVLWWQGTYNSWTNYDTDIWFSEDTDHRLDLALSESTSSLIKDAAGQPIECVLKDGDDHFIRSWNDATVLVATDAGDFIEGAGEKIAQGNALIYVPTQAETSGSTLRLRVVHPEATGVVSRFALLEPPPSVVAVREEIDANSAKLTDIVTDTNEVQTTLALGGTINNLLAVIGSALGDEDYGLAAAKEQRDSILVDTGTTIPEAIEANIGGVAQISADRVSKDQTFYIGSEGNEARNIVTLNAWNSGTITLALDLREVLDQADTSLGTVNSVTVTKVGGSPTITTSNLRKDRTQTQCLWDVAAINAANAGEYTVTVNYSTMDGQTKTVTCTRKLVVE